MWTRGSGSNQAMVTGLRRWGLPGLASGNAALLGVLLFSASRPSWMVALALGIGLVILWACLWCCWRGCATDSAEEAQRRERLANLSQDIYGIVDISSGGILKLNRAAERLLGYRMEEWMQGGLPFMRGLIHSDDLLHAKREIDRFLEARPSPSEEEPILEDIYRLKAQWGEYRWLKIRHSVLRRDPLGAPREMLFTAHDITDQRQMEIALVQAQEFESLGTLARRLAHDLNNILMGIQGYADLGLESAQNQSVVLQNMSRIRDSADRAAGICRQMLAYAGRSRIQIAPNQINDAVREGLPLVESLLPENTDLVLELEGDLPLANLDPNQARYALLHLVVNASESLGAGKGEVIVQTGACHLAGDGDPSLEGLSGDFVYLRVKDSGLGMGEETLSGVADPCFRSKHPGRGLGLLTVKGIASEHHGALLVKTSPETGSECTLYFPVAEKEAMPDPDDEGTPIAGGQQVVLLVDDEATIRVVLKECLEASGFKVIEAADGVDGFGAYVRHRSSISAVLLDLTMPRMGGGEVLAEIRKLDPRKPVVLMSGYSQREAMAAIGEDPFVDFLSKPCRVKEVLAAVRRQFA